MKTIKIFLASSSELRPERDAMDLLISRLNRLFKGREIVLEMVRWEDLDASMSKERKQNEYNKELRDCDICLVMFWRRFGDYTGEELDIAYNRLNNGEMPEKLYVFFKNPSGDDVTQELKDFMRNYEQRYGNNFFCTFENADALKLEFVLQFEMYQKDLLGTNIIQVRQEQIYLDNEAIADLNNIPFATNNEGYRKKQAELKSIVDEIAEIEGELDKKQQKLEKRRKKLEKDPDDEDYQEDYEDAKAEVEKCISKLQKRIDRRNALEKEFEEDQQRLLQTARRISELRGQKITERMKRAIEAFESGDAQRADIILDEAEKDADEALADVRMAKKVGLQSLEELILKTSVKMNNDSIPIERRIKETLGIYEKVDALAQECSYEKEKYIDFLFGYGDFLNKYAYYDKALEVFQKLMILCEDFYGKEHRFTATSYNITGLVYDKKGDYDTALEYYFKALAVREKVLGKEHPDTASSYNNIGLVYDDKGDHDKALEYNIKTLTVYKKVLGKEHPNTATSYDNIGSVYFSQGDNDKALEYSLKALEIRKKVLGSEHPNTATSYNNIGSVYKALGDYDKALEYHFKALVVHEKVLGKEHPTTATSYYNIGLLYYNLGDHDKALEYNQKALDIREKVLGIEHLDTSNSFNNIGVIYYSLKDYDKAIEYNQKALHIRYELLDEPNLDLASSFLNIAYAYEDKGEYETALEYLFAALFNREEVLGEEHPDAANIYSEIGKVYFIQEKYDMALGYHRKALFVYEKELGNRHPLTIARYRDVGNDYMKLGFDPLAQELFDIADQLS